MRYVLKDADELFRTSCSHNSARYSHIVKLALHFYAHLGAGHKGIKPLICKHIVVYGLLTLALENIVQKKRMM